VKHLLLTKVHMYQELKGHGWDGVRNLQHESFVPVSNAWHFERAKEASFEQHS